MLSFQKGLCWIFFLFFILNNARQLSGYIIEIFLRSLSSPCRVWAGVNNSWQGASPDLPNRLADLVPSQWGNHKIVFLKPWVRWEAHKQFISNTSTYSLIFQIENRMKRIWYFVSIHPLNFQICPCPFNIVYSKCTGFTCIFICKTKISKLLLITINISNDICSATVSNIAAIIVFLWVLWHPRRMFCKISHKSCHRIVLEDWSTPWYYYSQWVHLQGSRKSLELVVLIEVGWVMDGGEPVINGSSG